MHVYIDKLPTMWSAFYSDYDANMIDFVNMCWWNHYMFTNSWKIQNLTVTYVNAKLFSHEVWEYSNSQLGIMNRLSQCYEYS